MRLVDDILAEKDWRAKAWYLERTDAEQFGRVAERQILAPIGEPAAPNVTVIHRHDEKSDYMHRLQDEFREKRDGQPFSAPDSKTPPPPMEASGGDGADADASGTEKPYRDPTAARWKTHALAGRVGQTPTSDR